MLIGDKTERIVVDGDDLLHPYAIRPAYRADPNPPVWPEAARIAGNIAVWIVLPAAVWAAIVVAVIHAMMPVAR